MEDFKTADSEKEDAYHWAVQLVAQGHKKLDNPGHRVSIFYGIHHQPEDPPLPNRYIAQLPLRLDEETLFPKSAEHLPSGSHTLTTTFTTGLAHLQSITDPASYLTGLYDLLRRTTWCLPAPYGLGSEPDVSLFDYARVIAALMPCFNGPDTPAVTAINGDLSGVQEFIYTITARGAVSGLRGRSFYLQLLTEACARYLLNQLDLPQTSLIYNSGGHSLLLAPAGREETVQKAQQTISRLLLDRHQGDLYLALGRHEFQAADFHMRVPSLSDSL